MQFQDKDPFGYSASTYLWVIGLALLGGAVRYLNHSGRFSALVLARDLLTAAFAGLLTFWFCGWATVSGPLSAVLIATAGMMGTRALREFENFYRFRMGLPAEEQNFRDRMEESEIVIEVENEDHPEGE
jgi:hypothetical protein